MLKLIECFVVISNNLCGDCTPNDTRDKSSASRSPSWLSLIYLMWTSTRYWLVTLLFTGVAGGLGASHLRSFVVVGHLALGINSPKST
eukprot:2867840-Amphidinium_carterae.1